MTQPLNIAMVISADGSAAAKGIEEAKREVQGLGTSAKTSATGVTALASANDQAAAAARRAAQATVGQGQAEVQARTQVALSTGQLRMQTQNLSFQFQDIATMMATGQNPFTLLAQQLPQVTMHGGQLTGVMGALRQSFSGLLSPLGLLTTGFVLAGSAAISYFTDVDDEAANAGMTLEEQADLIQRVADRWGDAVPALREYAQALREATEAADIQTATQIVQNSYLDASRKLMSEVAREVERINQATASATGFDGFGIDATGLARGVQDATDALNEANEAIARGEDATGQLAAANDALTRLLNNGAIPAFSDMTNALTRLAESYGIASAAAQELNRQQAAAAAREANAGRMEKTGQRLGQGADPLSPTEFMGRFGWEEIFDIPKERKPARARKSDAERDAETYARIVRQAEMAIEMEMLEAQALGMTAEAADRLRITQELLNQARAAGIQLGPEQVAELTALGATMAQVTAETQAQAEAFELRRDVITDVIGGIRRAAEDGKITMQELLDISMRVLDRIIDKIQNELIDALMGVSGAGGGGGGLFGVIGQLFGFGGGNVALPATASIPSAAPRFSAGGFTGRGNPARPAGIVHQEEYVFSAPAVRAIGVGNLERMHRTAKSGRGFAEGGYTGGGMGMGIGGGMVSGEPGMQVVINNAPPGTRVREERGRGADGRELRKAIVDIVNEEMATGGIDGSMSRYGLSPRRVAR